MARWIVIVLCVMSCGGGASKSGDPKQPEAPADECAGAQAVVHESRSRTRLARSSTARADVGLLQYQKKQKIAILGLENVKQGGGSVDADEVRVAQDLTVALRLRPKAGQGPYQWTPGSEKELIDEKIMNNCSNEDKACMAKIGGNLGADYLMYGHIERKSQGGSAGYQISLKLLEVSKLAYSTWTDFIPLADTQNSSKLGDWARKGYKRLTNEYDGGTLVIVTKNAVRGTILVDGEERGNITDNRGEVVGLPEGRYKIAIVATGFCRFELPDKITIKNGETTTEEITLKEMRATR